MVIITRDILELVHISSDNRSGLDRILYELVVILQLKLSFYN